MNLLSNECRSSGRFKVRSAHGSVDVVRGFYTIFSVFAQMEEILQKDLIWFLFWRLVRLQQWKVCDCVSEHMCVIEL